MLFLFFVVMAPMHFCTVAQSDFYSVEIHHSRLTLDPNKSSRTEKKKGEILHRADTESSHTKCDLLQRHATIGTLGKSAMAGGICRLS